VTRVRSTAADCTVHCDAAEAIRWSTGAAILPDNFFLILVYGTLIYAFRHARSLAICLTVLGVATVTLRLLA